MLSLGASPKMVTDTVRSLMSSEDNLRLEMKSVSSAKSSSKKNNGYNQAAVARESSVRSSSSAAASAARGSRYDVEDDTGNNRGSRNIVSRRGSQSSGKVLAMGTETASVSKKVNDLGNKTGGTFAQRNMNMGSNSKSNYQSSNANMKKKKKSRSAYVSSDGSTSYADYEYTFSSNNDNDNDSDGDISSESENWMATSDLQSQDSQNSFSYITDSSRPTEGSYWTDTTGSNGNTVDEDNANGTDNMNTGILERPFLPNNNSDNDIEKSLESLYSNSYYTRSLTIEDSIMMEQSSSSDMSHNSNAEEQGEKSPSRQRREDLARLAVFAAHKVLAVGGSMTSAQAAASAILSGNNDKNDGPHPMVRAPSMNRGGYDSGNNTTAVPDKVLANFIHFHLMPLVMSY
eukprot:CAMPEP_0172477938 /NCGR_PEP_ID=MMETSP1066-20121228/1540_1 /TAXON_ID=671091 /ORGANISM="Coscinodiscus wailesii, Strain CCMP2513" /LENGTH=401 /DNA_ID=CAMNT_0013237007 /DNA_START=1 /DNA_END=1203 /DNA_ORIENTATION=-